MSLSILSEINQKKRTPEEQEAFMEALKEILKNEVIARREDEDCVPGTNMTPQEYSEFLERKYTL